MKTRDQAIAFLYENAPGFAAQAAPVFFLNKWTWATIGKVPDSSDILTTVMSLVWECVKSGGQNVTSTGRIQVFLRQTDRGDWFSGIELVPVSVRNH